MGMRMQHLELATGRAVRSLSGRVGGPSLASTPILSTYITMSSFDSLSMAYKTDSSVWWSFP